MKLTFLGSGRFGIDCLEGLIGSEHNVELIVTQPAKQAGRGRKATLTPAAQWAKGHHIKLIEVPDVNDAGVVEEIAAVEPDILIVIAFGQKIGSRLLNLAPKGAINVHASLLPKYRGAAPINWAIINGETHTGVSIIKITEKMDAGDIIAQAKAEIFAGETAGELHDRLAVIAVPLLLNTLGQIARGGAIYTAQDDSKSTLAPKLKKSDGFLDFNESADSLDHKIRGFWPWPGASAIYVSKQTARQERIVIARAAAVKSSPDSALSPGSLDENLNVVCGTGALEIIEIKPAGSNLMKFTDFVNGRRIKPGDMFIPVSD
ncbi:MAG: methionyl-tRNA formyltransferase [Sedimentisphaerales bacterium]|nr:methionyl-tRNA formyltransferase [Sedimentisphaerales bacterium]